MRLQHYISILLLACSSCATVRVAHVSRDYPSREPNCAIDVLTIQPKQAFEEVAILELEGDYTSLSAYLPKLKTAACEFGGDALLIQKMDTVNLYQSTPVGVGRALVIKYKR